MSLDPCHELALEREEASREVARLTPSAVTLEPGQPPPVTHIWTRENQAEWEAAVDRERRAVDALAKCREVVADGDDSA